MHFERFTAPGLKRRPRSSSSPALYWCARTDLIKAGLRPETVRLHYNAEDPSQHSLISATCMRLQAEMLEWSTGRGREARHFDGTILGLSRQYQTHPASPFKRVKYNTRDTDLPTLRLIERAFGSRALAAFKIDDFGRWYEHARRPKPGSKDERIRRAHGIIKKLREMFSFGVMAELPECARLSAILSKARFPLPSPRTVKLEWHHVEVFVATALESDRLSLAIGTAIQFKTMLRQRDVIGEWPPPLEPGEEPSGIVYRGRRWTNGLTWADLADDLELRKKTTKTGRFAAHDFKQLPFLLNLLDRVPVERRVGPLIIDEKAGRPYARGAYGREWRVIVRAAGIPDEIKNMDARSAGITEAENARASTDHIQAAAAHSEAKTTFRYMRGAIGKSRDVAERRQAHRAKNKAYTGMRNAPEKQEHVIGDKPSKLL